MTLLKIDIGGRGSPRTIMGSTRTADKHCGALASRRTVERCAVRRKLLGRTAAKTETRVCNILAVTSRPVRLLAHLKISRGKPMQEFVDRPRNPGVRSIDAFISWSFLVFFVF